MAKRTVRVLVELEIPYEEYKTKAQNSRADASIRRWISETARSELSFIPLYVEKEPDGSYIEDCTSKAKIVVTLRS